MKVLIDGVVHNRCPLCSDNEITDEQNICDYCKAQISSEMFKVKASFNNKYEFIQEVTEWLEREG